MKIDLTKREKLFTIISGRIDFFKSNSKESLTSDKVNKIVDIELSLSGLEYDDEDKAYLIREVEYYAQVKHTKPVAIYDSNGVQDWYTKLEDKNGMYWRLYRRYLEQCGSIDRNSINKLEQNTLPDLMNCLTDPNDTTPTKILRRGLVIGDVQSGKTSTYTGLVCKAADAGYKVVILLTGITETLRRQTQERMEEGIIGYTVRRVTCGTQKQKESKPVGVGKYERDVTPIAFTSYEDDFKGNVDNIASTLKSHKGIVMFVVKKNLTVLDKLYKWLMAFNKDVFDDMIHAPMLLVDDEADNASVNTSKDKYNPTKINGAIRKLCNAFNKCTYVGFTATPFANVFIDPETTKDMVNSDLFPENFIYVLPTPSTYIGAKKLFDEEEPLYQQCLKFITDIVEPTKEELDDEDDIDTRPLYYKHQKSWHGTFPNSLTRAIRCFYMANAIRDLRGDDIKPRTMMINVSRFTDVHQHILDYVNDIVQRDNKTISTDFKDKFEKNSKISLLVELKTLFEEHYSNCGFSVEQVLNKEVLISATKNIVVLKVNSKKGADKLDYKKNPSLRAIAIGGLSLSRGLTLEGLLVSYFYRNTATFDVLMQMGRWFGYRKNYEDLCQIWISGASASWYKMIFDSTEELKDDLRQMFDDGLTPKEFGIRVHDISDDLQITASNKMRTAINQYELLSFWGDLFETPYFSANIAHNNNNLRLINDFFANLQNEGNLHFDQSNHGTVLVRDVPKVYVSSLLSNIDVSLKNVRFYISEMRAFLGEEDDARLNDWDVVIFSGNSETTYSITETCRVNCMERSFQPMDGRCFGFTGSAGRLGSKTDALYAIKNEISESQKREIEQAYENDRGGKVKSYPGKIWFKYVEDRKPCLMIYLVRPPLVRSPKKLSKSDPSVEKYISELGKNPVVGFGVGFPKNGDTFALPKKFKINKIRQQQWLDELGEGAGDDDDLL